MVYGIIFWLLIIYLMIRMFFYRHKKIHHWLQREIPLWEQKNIISYDQGNAILDFYQLKRIKAREKVDMVRILTLIGAILIGIGIIFFVASNRQEIPAHLYTLMLLTITLSTLYAGYFFSYEKGGFILLGKALLLLACLFWGGTIALIGQIYHIPTSANWYIMLLWAFPILPIAIFFKNDYVHILSSLLFAIWNFLYMVNNHIANYCYPIIVFTLMFPTAKNLTISRRLNIIGLVSASVYCCFNKYEWLALFISAGLLIYYLMQPKERVYLYTACLSSVLWAITYFTVREQQPNFYFLLPAGFLLYLTYKDNLRENLVIWLIGLITWLNLTFTSISKMYDYKFDILNFLVFHAFLGILIYAVGIIAKKKGHSFFEIYKGFGYLIMFICVYLLSFRDILVIGAEKVNSYVYVCGSLSALLITLLLTANGGRGGYFKKRDTRLELMGLLTALTVNSVIMVYPKQIFMNTIIANALLVIFALTNIFLGAQIKKSSVFTVGIIIFVLFIITRYIDVGWRLKEKSLFFIVGGIVILSLGTFLEKQRRKIIERMKV